MYVARLDGGVPADPTWRELEGLQALPSREEWGLARHDHRAQVRALRVPAGAPDRVVAGVEVGGVFVSEDGGDTWTDRRIEGFDAPHTDDIHHLAVADSETIVAATGSGLYRTTDLGRHWRRLDTGHRQSYVRESFVAGGVRVAGAAPTPPSSWLVDTDHALFACRDGCLETVPSPTPDEVVVAGCETDDGSVAATNQGTLLHRQSDGWTVLGSVPAPDAVHGRCIPLAWLER